MKKKTGSENNVRPTSQTSYQQSSRSQQFPFLNKYQFIFQFNYQLIASTINQKMKKPTHLAIINKIVQRQPSKQLIFYQEIEKNLVFQEYLNKYHHFDSVPQKIKKLIIKHLPNIKANYMDFKIKNFLILNKYKVNERCNLPYPLSNKFQKQTDSKMSSTKSVQNKVLQQLQKQSEHKGNSKSHRNLLKQIKSPNKKNKNSKINKAQNFQIKQLTKSIGQMIQNIKDNRALQNFKKQMQMSQKLNCGVPKYNYQKAKEKIDFIQKRKPINTLSNKTNQFQIKYLREKQFKRNMQNDMNKYFPDQKNKSKSLKKKKSGSKDINHYGFLSSKNKSKSKMVNYLSTQRLQTNPQPEIQQYGLSIIRQKRKSKSRHMKSKSRQYYGKNSQSISNHQFGLGKRLDTQYSSSSNQRLNTGHSILAKSKSSSRIPTQYDSTVIVRDPKFKSKHTKDEKFMFYNFSKNKDKPSSSKKNLVDGLKMHKSKSKSKPNLFQFSSPNKK